MLFMPQAYAYRKINRQASFFLNRITRKKNEGNIIMTNHELPLMSALLLEDKQFKNELALKLEEIIQQLFITDSQKIDSQVVKNLAEELKKYFLNIQAEPNAHPTLPCSKKIDLNFYCRLNAEIKKHILPLAKDAAMRVIQQQHTAVALKNLSNARFLFNCGLLFALIAMTSESVLTDIASFLFKSSAYSLFISLFYFAYHHCKTQQPPSELNTLFVVPLTFVRL